MPDLSEKQSNKQQGSVLILVLWVLMLLSLIAGFYAVDARINRNLSQFEAENLQAKEVVKSLLTVFSLRLASAESIALQDAAWNDGQFFADGVPHKIKIGPHEIFFILEDEQGKIDLNTTQESDIKLGVELILGDKNKKSIDQITDAILDWRDPDNIPRPNGAEDEIYEKKTPPYKAANRPFYMLEELLAVDGITYEMFYGAVSEEAEEGQQIYDIYGLQHIFTVYNPTGQMIKDYAPKQLVEAVEERLVSKPTAHDVLKTYIRFDGTNHIVFWKQSGQKGSFELIRWQEMTPSHPLLVAYEQGKIEVSK